MLRIVSDRKKLELKFEELERDYAQGNISKKEYFAQKRDLGQDMETLNAADRVRRMQGRMGTEKTLDHWSEQEDESKKLAEEAEKEEMLKKYITNPNSIKGREIPTKEWFGKRAQMGLVAFIVLALVVGTSMGFLFINKPSEVSTVSMLVNESAFPPVVNNTTTITSTNYTRTVDYTPTATTNTPTTTNTPKETPSNTATNTTPP